MKNPTIVSCLFAKFKEGEWFMMITHLPFTKGVWSETFWKYRGNTVKFRCEFVLLYYIWTSQNFVRLADTGDHNCIVWSNFVTNLRPVELNVKSAVFARSVKKMSHLIWFGFESANLKLNNSEYHTLIKLRTKNALNF